MVVVAGTRLTRIEMVWARGELPCTPALPSQSLVVFDFHVPHASLQPQVALHLPAIDTCGCLCPPPCQTCPLGGPSAAVLCMVVQAPPWDGHGGQKSPCQLLGHFCQVHAGRSAVKPKVSCVQQLLPAGESQSHNLPPWCCQVPQTSLQVTGFLKTS